VSSDAFVPIAEAVKAVGLRGEIKLYPLLDWFEPLLATDHLVWDDGVPVTVRGQRPAGNCIVVRIAGCDDRDAAQAHRGRRLGFRRRHYAEASFPKPAGGLPFRYLGREVHLGDGRLVGVVDEVRRCGPQHMLVVLDGVREILIPAVAPILRADAALSGPLVIDPPEGLLDVAGD